MMGKRLLVIIPAYNEEGNIGSAIRDVQNCKEEAEIIVVNDASSDRTSTIARSFKVISIIDLPINLGIGGAVQTGFLYALGKDFDIALQFDGDGQHLASEIPKLIAPLLSGEADVSIGSRFLAGPHRYRTTFFRRLGMKLIQYMNTWLIGQRITDNTSGFRAYDRKAIEFLAGYYPDDYPEPEAVVLLGRNGFKLTEVPVAMQPRKQGVSSLAGIVGPYYMMKVVLTLALTAFRPKIRRG